MLLKYYKIITDDNKIKNISLYFFKLKLLYIF